MPHFISFVCSVFAGFVHLQLPPGLVCQDNRQSLSCTTVDDLEVTATWSLLRGERVFDITNGTEVQVTSRQQETTVVIQKIDKKWAGMQG